MRGRRTGRLRLAAGALVGLAAGGSLAFYALLSEPRGDLSVSTVLANLREVDPGRFYRSGQLSPAQLREAAETFGIRTVINLRGHDTSAPWYRAEAQTARALGIALHNVHLSSSRLPHPHELRNLLKLYREAERPILVHCDGGADRAGEASALYALEHMGATADEALEMLSWRYRHFSWWKPAKRYFIERYRGEQWARSGYDPCDVEFAYYDRSRHCS